MILHSSRHVSRFGAMLLACSALVAIPVAAQEAPSVVHFGKWGVDLTTRDTSVKPGDDFQRYAAGKWMDENEIPADKSQNGVGSELNDRNQEQLRAIVASSPADSQIGAFYKSYMDEARIEQLDAAPLKADLDRVAAIKTKAEFAKSMANAFSDFGGTLFGVGSPSRSGEPDDEHCLRRLWRHGPAGPRLLPARQVQNRSATRIAHTSSGRSS